MMRITGNLNNIRFVACSGGIDSMVLLHFLAIQGRRQVTVAHYNHGTEYGERASIWLREWCKSKSIPMTEEKLTEHCPPGESKEFWWRNKRYGFFATLPTQAPESIAMAHHLDDAYETWLMTSLHGEPRYIPHKRGVFVRPFLLATRSDIISYAARHNVEHIEDPSNADVKYPRNKLRHVVIPELRRINPGLSKVFARKMMVEIFKHNEVDSNSYPDGMPEVE